MWASRSLNNEPYENTLFISIGVQDKYKGSDSYESLQAADQITESIQGWFKDPSFQKELSASSKLGYSIKAKKQEKNNLLVNFSSADENSANLYKQSIVETLNKRISSYNQLSDLQINLAATTLDISRKADALPLYLMLSALIGLIFGVLISFFYENLFGKIGSLDEFRDITGLNSPFVFSSVKNLKSNHYFLIKYLNQHYRDQKVQLLDLTHKSKIGLEMLSRLGQFRDIKSYDLPRELEKIDPEYPTVIICELGHTTKQMLRDLSLLKFTSLEAIILDRI
jgi:capsular polysaccharide biosynthesis protein